MREGAFHILGKPVRPGTKHWEVGGYDGGVFPIELGAIGVQLYNGYYEFEPLVYLQGLLLYFQFPIYFMCVMAVFFYVMTRSRYLTMFLVVVYSIALIAIPPK